MPMLSGVWAIACVCYSTVYLVYVLKLAYHIVRSRLYVELI